MLGSRPPGYLGLLHRLTKLIVRLQSPDVVLDLQCGVGHGYVLVWFADLLILTKYFKARLAFANGIIAFGGAVGGSILNPSMQQMFIHFGIANMFRVLSGALLIFSSFSLVYRPKRGVFPHNNDAIDIECDKKCTFDWEILKNKAFITWIAVIFIFMLGYMVPFVHLVSIFVITSLERGEAVSLANYLFDHA